MVSCDCGVGEQMRQAYIKYILSGLLFGLNGVVASYIALTSYEIVLLRLVLGSGLLLLVFLGSRQRFGFWQHKRDMGYVVLSGVSMGASWLFVYEAYQQIGVSLASLAYYCGPVIVMVLSPLLFGEKLTWTKLTAFAAVLIGVFLVNGQALVEGRNLWGLFCGGMSAVTYAVMVIFNKKAVQLTGLANTILQMLAGLAVVAIFVASRQSLLLTIPDGSWLPVLVLGLVNTGVGCYWYFSSIGFLPVQTVAILGYLELLSAVVFSVLLLHEVLLPMQLLGALLILGGAVLGECGLPKRRRQRAVKME